VHEASPVETVLDRLDGVRHSGRGWTARCPAHEDRHASLSVSEGDDGRVLLHDHAGCIVDDVIAALGLELMDLFPPREGSPIRQRPAPYRLPRRRAEILLARPALLLEVALAQELARLSDADAFAAFLSAWRPLTDHVDYAFVFRLASVIRGVALLRFGNARELTPRWADELREYLPSDGLDRAVSRLLRRIA
jgi:hypothetical protein